jgi:acyl carrier protein
MASDSDTPILEPVFAAIHRAGGLGDIPVLAGDKLTDLGLSRLRLLAALIELEDKFDIEFPADAVNCFRIVGDIAVYIESHAMMLYDDDTYERPAAASHPVERRQPGGDRLHRLCAHVFCRIFGVAVPAVG